MDVQVTILHNSDCSKSREALDYLYKKGLQPHVWDYVQHPPSIDWLKELAWKLGVSPSSLIRPAEFRRLNLQPSSDPEVLFSMIAEHPMLLQRPIVVVGDRVCIARPAQAVDSIIHA
ncbi:Arsenate reductase [Posidoniimonas polymericola]|uniref:Arsenate reductase n=1 Tax=Posidoniimonas polymericola TaxID=2528002 RepID=A0A5C5ZFU6_9BACT|nr:ArsC/Spx/MgsR family protein [Posidoniimonas polymericola]TWT85907.1 Arsenate reductase [Posidoniimonas polymericola]